MTEEVEKFYCLCSCGSEVKPGNKYIHGHSTKGKKHNEEAKKKISFSLSGEKNPNFGKYWDEEQRARISVLNKGRKHSEEARRKISVASSNRTHSQETKIKMSLLKIGDKNHFWFGGIEYYSYGPGNTKELKEQIRIRDNYTCQECGRIWEGNGYKFSPHHIDYNKNNHVPWNRITLCVSCHGKTSSNRKYWIERLYSKRFSSCLNKIIGK